MNDSNNKSNDIHILTELNGELTELTEKEIALLFDYRTANNEEKAKIEELIEKTISG